MPKLHYEAPRLTIPILNTQYLRLDATNDPLTAGLEVNTATAVEPVLILQTTDDNATNPILEIQASGGGMLSEIEKDGNLNFATATAANPGMIEINDVRFMHTFGSDNIFLGPSAGNFTMTGDDNIGIGAFALTANTTGDTEVAIGSRALEANLSGIANLAIGANALRVNTTGQRNVAIGSGTLRLCISGEFNTAVGGSALFSVTGNNNTGVGTNTCRNTTTGANNTGIGLDAIRYNETGSNNVGIGRRAGRGVSGNSYANNSIVGTEAAFVITTSSNNAILGYRAGFALATGGNNILLGYQAGDVLTTGIANIIIGYDIDPSAAGASNELNIGGIVFGDLSVPDVRLGTLSTDYFITQGDGDSWWVGGGGLPFGSFWGNDIAFTVAGGTGTFKEVVDADITVGQTHNTTFQNDKEIAVSIEGMYLVTWSMSLEADSGAGKHLVGAIGVDVPGGADVLVAQNDGMAHVFSVGNAENAMGGTAILDLVAGSEVGLMVTIENDDTDVTVQHVNLSLVQIGGT